MHDLLTSNTLFRSTLLFAVSLLLAHVQVAAADDPLPSWNDGDTKTAIVEFVRAVSDESHADFLPPAQRIAVFDNDGTLWPENPLPFQLSYAIDEVKRLAPTRPEWSDDPVVQAALDGDMGTLLKGGHAALIHLIALSHAGITTDEFDKRVANWLASASHPRFHRPYNKLTYAPMVELLRFMRQHGFRTYIVSGGGVDFMRVWAEEAYGIPPEQVVGSYLNAEYQFEGQQPVVMKKSDIAYVDDKAGKPVAIHRFIGRRPIACFGNSDGDKEMLEWTTVGRSPSLGAIVHHTDRVREYAYDAKPKSSGKLVEALDDSRKRGWLLIDMQRDWKTVFQP